MHQFGLSDVESTAHPLLRLDIYSSHQNKQHIIATFLDFTQAFDRSRRALLVQVSQDSLRQVELVEGMFVRPHSLLNTLAQAQQDETLVAPASVERNHEQRAANSGSVLSDVSRIRHQCKVF